MSDDFKANEVKVLWKSFKNFNKDLFVVSRYYCEYQRAGNLRAPEALPTCEDLKILIEHVLNSIVSFDKEPPSVNHF